jgi:hypothetical protein
MLCVYIYYFFCKKDALYSLAVEYHALPFRQDSVYTWQHLGRPLTIFKKPSLYILSVNQLKTLDC